MPTGVIDTWGSSVGERARTYPCDELLERADKALFRAVTVGAPSQLVFEWLCQLQAAPYSYDWIDHGDVAVPASSTPPRANSKPGSASAVASAWWPSNRAGR